MASHPYISGAGNIALMVNHLRKSFPGTVSSDTVKKLGIASNNESYVINALQFVGVIDEEGKKTAAAGDVFHNDQDEDFAKAFEPLVREAYYELFDIFGDEAWTHDKSKLVTFFRKADKTSAAVGARQASTFQVFAALSGHGEVVQKAKASGKAKAVVPLNKSAKAVPKKTPAQAIEALQVKSDMPVVIEKGKRDMALTVRIEINLPADGSRETYDNIFQSIRENLMDK